MREHPIPQDITGYRFHLVGNMTLGQFAEVLAGVGLAFIVYKTGLPDIIRWPLAFLFAATGAMAAFVPIEERPLDHWIKTFIRTLFKPTKFFWKREPKIPDLFNYKPDDDQSQPDFQLDLAPAKKQKIYQYLQSINQGEEKLDEYEAAEKERESKIISEFSEVLVNSRASKENVRPNLKVRVREMKQLDNLEKNIAVFSNDVGGSSAREAPHQDSPIAQRAVSQDRSSTEPAAQSLSPQPDLNKIVPQESLASDQPISEDLTQVAKQKINSAPQTPPNQISGTLYSADGDLVTSAIIELKNSDGQSITACSSNSLGQFSFSKNLSEGEYFLNITALGHFFQPVPVSVVNKPSDHIQLFAESLSNDRQNSDATK